MGVFGERGFGAGGARLFFFFTYRFASVSGEALAFGFAREAVLFPWRRVGICLQGEGSAGALVPLPA